MKTNALPGFPVSPRLQRQLGVRMVAPPEGSRIVRCGLCGERIWLGPFQIAFINDHPVNSTPVCFNCVIALNPGYKELKHLGGTSGSYQMMDGRIISSVTSTDQN
jgi:hypothetical protein